MRVTDYPIVDARWALPGALAHATPHRANEKPRNRTPRDWAVDIAIFLLAGFIWFILVITSTDSYQVLTDTGELVPHPAAAQGFVATVVDPIVGALLILSLWWRRKFPAALAIIAVILSCFFAATGGTVFILLFSLAVHRPWPISVPISIAMVPGFLLFEQVRPGDATGPSLLMTGIFSALTVTAVLAWGIAVRARRQLVLSLRTASEQERREHQMLLTGARRAERESIAREMHDVLAHRISLLSVHAGALEYRTDQASSGTGTPLTSVEVHSAVAVIRENAHLALEELREVLTVLRADTPVGAPLECAETGTAAPQVGMRDLDQLVVEARAAGQQVHLDLSVPEVNDLRPQVQRTVYRAVQEGLTNARKHAPLFPVNVVVRATVGENVTVEVTNVVPLTNSPSEIPGAGAGLTGLRERVAIEGGTLNAGRSGGAFHLVVALPWRT